MSAVQLPNETIYALAGTAAFHLILPPAFQVDTPFGAGIAGVNPAFIASEPDAGAI